MKKRIPSIIAIWLLADLYFFQAIKTLTASNFILWGYWLFDIFIAAGVFYTVVFRKKKQISPKVISLLMALMLLLLVPKLFALPVLLVEDITRLFRGFPPRTIWVSYLAIIVAAIPFVSLLFGMTKGRHFYRVCKETLRFKDLPDAFDGFTITQLSDIHAGSFSSEKGVQKGIDLVNAQNSDLILFTGDLVNNQAVEMDPWIPAFAELKGTYGKYSVLGNHDYGDYIKWETKGHKYANLNRLKKIHGELGFKLLLNEAVEIKKDGQSIALIGVENWGKGGFHKYGDLKKAAEDIPDDAFKILMSHDPSHWDAITLDHHQHVHLTLSGHTHGMQFGIELFGFKWSPVKYIYKQWAGLYQKNGKYLYINRGFGFLGFRGRLGIWPEITVITLKKINP
jgi:predicted MPP superfamily phosphohydrolase